jgi:hypothetical protein
MPANGVVLVRGARPPRRWPSVLVTIVAVFSLALTGFLFLRDRENAAAATSSRTNAPKDALAVATLGRLAQTMNVDASMRLAGVDGLRAIALADFHALVVAPLGGAIGTGPNQWTLALDGGWACLTWHQSGAEANAATVRLGECTDDAPLVSTVGVTMLQWRTAEAAMAGRERAAFDAADAAAAFSSTSVGYNPRFSLPVLSTRFAQLHDVGFRTWATLTGMTVATRDAAACLQPTATETQVRVLLGPCD